MSDNKAEPEVPTQCAKCQKDFSDVESEQALLLRCEHRFCRKCLVAMKRDTEIMCPIDYKTTVVRFVSDLKMDREAIQDAIYKNRQKARMNNMAQDVNETLAQTVVDPYLVPANLDFLNATDMSLDLRAFKCVELKIEDSTKRVFALETTTDPVKKTSDKTIKVIDFFDEEDKTSSMETWKFALKTLTVDGVIYQLLGISDVISPPQEPPAPKIKVRPNHLKRMGSNENTTLANLKFGLATVKLDQETGKILIVA